MAGAYRMPSSAGSPRGWRPGDAFDAPQPQAPQARMSPPEMPSSAPAPMPSMAPMLEGLKASQAPEPEPQMMQAPQIQQQTDDVADFVSGPSALRQGIGRRNPPSLEAVLQGLRY